MSTASLPTAEPGSGEQTDEQDWQALYQQAPCGHLSMLDDGTIVAVNDTLLGWLGRPRQELLGRGLGALLPVGDRILLATHVLPQLRLTGLVEETAVELVAADGTVRAALLTAARTPANGAQRSLTRVAVFSARGRRRYEQDLLAALRQAEQAETQRASAQAELRHLELHDPLTGLPNRAALTPALAAAVAAARHAAVPADGPVGLDLGTGAGAPAAHPPAAGLNGTSLSVLLIDLDHFKCVNDALGHAAGDALLVEVAERMRASLRGTATLSRLSSDEFVVVDQLAGAAAATALAARLLQVLSEPVVVQDLEIVVGASIGVVVSHGPGQDPEELLRAADIAMFRAKEAGRGRWHLHDPRRADPEVDRLRRLGELRHAIRDGQLRLHYQPQIDLASGTIHAVEALVRWQHPTRGLLAPSEFIDLAEQTGLIGPLGAWVLDEAVRQAAAWHAARRTSTDSPPGPPQQMAVNLSARQLADPQLVALVAQTLTRHRLPAHRLVLEITETALMADADAALRALTALKALGVRLSVDDFGTRYSSLTYLKRFPVDELKIDRSFVAGLGSDSDSEDTAIIASCVQLAHALKLRVVAEGVETEQQRQALHALDCDLAQGYLLGRPAPGSP